MIKVFTTALIVLFGNQIYAQNVGINVSNPQFPLTISSSNPVAGVIGLDNNASLFAKNASGIYETFLVPRNINNSTTVKFGAGGLFIDPFGATGNKMMSMLANGNVGIGTNNPLDKLMVQTGTNQYGITHTSGTVKLGTYVGDTGGWLGTQSNHPLFFFTNNGSARMTINTNGLVGIGTTNPVANLDVSGDTRLTNDGNYTSGTVSIGTNSNNETKFRLNSSLPYGLSIDGSAPNGSIGLGAMLKVQGASEGHVVAIGGTAEDGYNLYVNGSAAKSDANPFWTLFSDARLKDQIVDYNSGLADLVKIKPVKYHYTKASGFNSDKENIGILAQDLLKIAPYMVGKKKHENGEEYHNVNLSPMLFMMVNAFKELDTSNKAKDQQIADLEARLAKIEQLLKSENRNASIDLPKNGNAK